MKTIEATFQVVTPMFLGGEKHKASSIRPPSIKGALRFWWRALNWQKALAKNGNDKNKALKWLHKEEARLFGAAVEEGAGGQGVFLLRVTSQDQIELMSDWPLDPVRGTMDGSTYISFGITKSGSLEKGNLKRHRIGIKEGISFTVKLGFKGNVSDKDIQSIQESLEAFGTLGGLGSRSRRGLGSIALIRLNNKNIDMSEVTYKQKVNQLFASVTVGDNKLDEKYPPYTAFTSHALHRFFRVDKEEARKLHKRMGNSYREFRGQLRGEAKIPFGIPLLKISKEKERRGSPVFFHIHPVGDSYMGLIYFLPAEFHPKYAVDFNKDVKRFVEVGK